MEGQQLGNYQVLQKLGEGGMGTVYLGRHAQLGQPIAIKVLKRELSSDAEMVQRFFNEAHAATTIRNPGIVQIFDFGRAHDGSAYFVMELLEGTSLGGRLQERRLAYAETCRIGRQVANVLQAAHQRGITHRDLKPDNLFLVPDPEVNGGERVKVLDFGIAKLANEAQASGVKTATGFMMGTPLYMSPEQCRGAGAVDARSDVYSLGCILYEMVCGRPPFVGQGMGEIIGAHQFMQPVPPQQVAPDVPPQLAALIIAMLDKQPANRPATMAQVGQVLAEIGRTLDPGAHQSQPFMLQAPAAGNTTLGSSVGMMSTSTAGPAPIAAKKSRAPMLVVGGLAAGGVAAAVIAFVATRGDGTGATLQPAAAPRDADTKVAAADAPAPPAENEWIAITPPATPIAIGMTPRKRDEKSIVGLRPSRKVMTPAQAFAIQQHEVTYGELAAWLAQRPYKHAVPAWVPAEHATWPVTNVPWKIAGEYCASLGGALPTEAQWELAARGVERRPYAWGTAQLNALETRAYGAADATPQPVMSSPQDKTPEGVHDLMGNVQEWTADLWIEDSPGQDESWVKDGETTFRAVRGLPLRGKGPPPDEGAAYREPLCATGTCAKGAAAIQELIGFRCVRTTKEKS